MAQISSFVTLQGGSIKLISAEAEAMASSLGLAELGNNLLNVLSTVYLSNWQENH